MLPALLLVLLLQRNRVVADGIRYPLEVSERDRLVQLTAALMPLAFLSCVCMCASCKQGTCVCFVSVLEMESIVFPEGPHQSSAHDNI